MRTIPLTRGLVAIVDDDDFDHISQYRWHAKPNGKTTYAVRWLLGNRLMRMHREIMRASPSQIVDHISCDGLDNRKANLRFCTPSQNSQNLRRTERNTSGHKGVYWDKDRQKWRSRIKVSGKRIDLGRFDSAEGAASAYALAAVKYFGEFARVD